ncbi:hypothetical protein CP978_02965 [Streptomyces nodosus]|uniref:Beta-ketoacyl synthase-like N-terminal domain-containing protein n=1 Tax=Streptomyces nodosus TaxID=40318 RepID=A0A5P2VYD1_9ACTN|nr:hypothetical protein CP978_02965 [Streptomyces nodosus]
MSPREALSTDSQQRLLLETSMGSDRAGRYRPRSGLRGSATGVFAGVMYSGLQAAMLASPSSRASRAAAVPRAWLPAGSRTPSASRVRQSRWTPRARRRWWRCTGRCRPCARVRSRSPWQAV